MEKNSVLFDKLKSIVGSENITNKDIIMEAYTASYNLKERDSPGLYGTKFIEKPKKPSFIVRAGSLRRLWRARQLKYLLNIGLVQQRQKR